MEREKRIRPRGGLTLSATFVPIWLQHLDEIASQPFPMKGNHGFPVSSKRMHSGVFFGGVDITSDVGLALVRSLGAFIKVHRVVVYRPVIFLEVTNVVTRPMPTDIAAIKN
ncbi:hypothetical protein BHE74_00001874 [Ensete ventricosum]|nr:hypothetical protein GW17_00002575 [Ensete ventricosum]RWW89154.1 hypothetical protein BHE74_00001874 [Ensete ventricosum]RZR94611.1 hypothetical protein BHM03_00023341 [Ensete ventricosum]